jgi:hypothetical protein
MKTEFKLGQIFCSKNRPKRANSKGEYYVVIQEESDTKRLALLVINSNRDYVSGAIIEPEYPEIDLEEVVIKASDLLDEEITIMEIDFNELVTSKAIRIIGEDKVIKFTSVGDDIKANVEYEIKSPSFRLMGNLYYDFHHKDKFVKS